MFFGTTPNRRVACFMMEATKHDSFPNPVAARLNLVSGKLMDKLYTIGYERASLEDFIETLRLFDIDVLLDVRELPMSRRRGFAKTALRNALDEAGIEYKHEKNLGSPKPVRDRLKSDWNFSRFFREYDRHLDSHRSLVEHLSAELEGRVTLMCYERNHCECHRSSVASMMADLTGLKPQHVGVQGWNGIWGQ